MDLLEGLNPETRPREPSHGPRSQGGVDDHYAAELQALMDLPSMSCAFAEVDERAPTLLRAVHVAANPGLAAFSEDRLAAMFSEYLLELRETYRSVHSPGKRPWPAFMEAAQSGELAAQDCDAVYAMTRVHVVGRDKGGVLIGDFLAGSDLGTPVLLGDGSKARLLDVLPPVAPLAPSLRGAALVRACHDTACRTRVQAASGFRRMMRDEQLSEAARRSAEIADARKRQTA